MDRNIVSGAELYWDVFPCSQRNVWQHLHATNCPVSVLLRLKGFNSNGAEINELSHLGELAWVRKPLEDGVK